MARPASSSTHTTEASACVGESGLEQPRLGVEVVLHRRVEVEVVARQVGEAADRELDAVDPAERSARGWTPPSPRCRRRARAITASSACRSGASGVVSALGTSAPAIRMPTVPIRPGDPVGRPQPRLDQICGGGLAGGAGHPDHPQRVATGCRRRRPPAHRAPTAGRDGPARGTAASRAACDGHAVRIGEHRDRAAADGVSGVAPAVRRRAGQRGEQITRLGVLAAQGDAGDADFRHLRRRAR